MSVVRLAELMQARRPCVVLTGAGISTESGIPDFRSPGGIWAEYDPMEYATIDAFLADPAKVWDFYSKRLTLLGSAEPNDGHRALAELEERDWVRAVITQNIDRLHRKAGSENVVEVHGSIEWSVCPECGARVGIERVIEKLRAGVGTPECEACITPLKPDVVLFGELLPEEAMSEAFALASEADVMVAIGSSLEVYPVASLPGVTLENGGCLALVTQGRTPYDADAEVKLTGDVVDELDAVLEALDR